MGLKEMVAAYIEDNFETDAFMISDLPIVPFGKVLSDGTDKVVIYGDLIRDSVVVVFDDGGEYRWRPMQIAGKRNWIGVVAA